jgi:26S proteasome regulatory subunit N2
MSLNCVFQNDVPGMLAYSLKLCMSLMQNKQFRNKVLRVLVKIYMNLEKPDFINVCQVLTLISSLCYTTACYCIG